MARGASNVLYMLGWRNHRVLEEGLPGWYEKGYPVEGTHVSKSPRH
jgi:3-mercaptopyruvate sulfurtransferase SseA